MRLEYGVSTNTGQVRKRNEDSYACNPDLGLFIVADGMGGHPGGHIASAIAVNKTEEEYKRREDLKGAIEFADFAIRSTPPRNMGTTIVATVFREDSVTVAHAGDSRLYLFRQGSLHPLTQDHTAAGQNGTSVHSHVLLNALGVTSAPFSVTVNRYAALKGDVYLLCSDGLYGELTAAQIAKLLSLKQSMQEVAEALVDTAVHLGGRDNVTVICTRLS